MDSPAFGSMGRRQVVTNFVHFVELVQHPANATDGKLMFRFSLEGANARKVFGVDDMIIAVICKVGRASGCGIQVAHTGCLSRGAWHVRTSHRVKAIVADPGSDIGSLPIRARHRCAWHVRDRQS